MGRFPSFPSECIYITLGNKGTSKYTKMITNLVFLEENWSLLSSHSFIAFSQQFSTKICQNSFSIIQEMTRQSFHYPKLTSSFSVPH